jgi:hypothetical protein
MHPPEFTSPVIAVLPRTIATTDTSEGVFDVDAAVKFRFWSQKESRHLRTLPCQRPRRAASETRESGLDSGLFQLQRWPL